MNKKLKTLVMCLIVSTLLFTNLSKASANTIGTTGAENMSVTPGLYNFEFDTDEGFIMAGHQYAFPCYNTYDWDIAGGTGNAVTVVTRERCDFTLMVQVYTNNMTYLTTYTADSNGSNNASIEIPDQHVGRKIRFYITSETNAQVWLYQFVPDNVYD